LQLAKVYHHPAGLIALLGSSFHFAETLQNTSISRKIHVAWWRCTTRRPAIGLGP
jgi:hypothetical protein